MRVVGYELDAQQLQEARSAHASVVVVGRFAYAPAAACLGADERERPRATPATSGSPTVSSGTTPSASTVGGSTAPTSRTMTGGTDSSSQVIGGSSEPQGKVMSGSSQTSSSLLSTTSARPPKPRNQVTCSAASGGYTVRTSDGQGVSVFDGDQLMPAPDGFVRVP